MAKAESEQLRQLVQDPECYEEHERSLATCLWEGVASLLRRHGVEQTPIILLRSDDVVASFLVVRRLERRLVGGEGGCADLEEKKPAKDVQLQLIEALGRARERLRKAMKELEETCGKVAVPSEVCIPDQMKPILKEAEGILEKCLESGPRRKRRTGKAPKPEAARET